MRDPRPTVERVGVFETQHGTAEQYINEAKHAVTWRRLHCCLIPSNAVELQLHPPACDHANFMPILRPPKKVKHRSSTTLREKLVTVGAKVALDGRYVTFRWPKSPCPGTWSGRFCA